MSRVLGIGVETTGLDAERNEIVRFAAYGYDDDDPMEPIEYERMFGVDHPENWSARSSQLSGLCADDVDGFSTFADVISDDESSVRELLDGCDVIVSHNVPFLIGFLDHAGYLRHPKYGDTLIGFRRYLATRRLSISPSLVNAADMLKVGNVKPYDTLSKARTAYYVWVRLLERRYCRPETIRDIQARI